MSFDPAGEGYIECDQVCTISECSMSAGYWFNIEDFSHVFSFDLPVNPKCSFYEFVYLDVVSVAERIDDIGAARLSCRVGAVDLAPRRGWRIWFGVLV